MCPSGGIEQCHGQPARGWPQLDRPGMESGKCRFTGVSEPNSVVVSKIFHFHPYPGKWSNLTNIFQMGWNHQLAKNENLSGGHCQSGKHHRQRCFSHWSEILALLKEKRVALPHITFTHSSKLFNFFPNVPGEDTTSKKKKHDTNMHSGDTCLQELGCFFLRGGGDSVFQVYGHHSTLLAVHDWSLLDVKVIIGISHLQSHKLFNGPLSSKWWLLRVYPPKKWVTSVWLDYDWKIHC